MKISCCRYLCLSEDHEFKPAKLNRLDCQRYPKYPDVANVEYPNDKPGWAWGPTERRRQRQVDPDDSMFDQAGEVNGRPGFGGVSLKIHSVVAYTVYTAVQLCRVRK